MRIAVTGGSGKLGRTVVRELRDRGHEVVNLDRDGQRAAGFVPVETTDFGQVIDALAGVDRGRPVEGLVHLAAIPAPGLLTDAATFTNNITSTFNVLWAAVRLGITRIVHASSETVLGLPFDTPPPYIPVDEEYPARPESVYSLVKHLEETMGVELCRWYPELSVSGFRFSNVMDPEDYARFPDFDGDAQARKWNLWGYIDGRDAAQAIDLALADAPTGYQRYIIANGDTVMSRPNAELVAEVFPGVEYHPTAGPNDTLLSIEKARRILGYEPQHSWRDEISG